MLFEYQTRCQSSFIPKYLASLTIFVFCPLILKFICFLISIFFVLKRIISGVLVFNEIEPVNYVIEIEIYLFVDVFEGLA